MWGETREVSEDESMFEMCTPHGGVGRWWVRIRGGPLSCYVLADVARGAWALGCAPAPASGSTGVDARENVGRGSLAPVCYCDALPERRWAISFFGCT
jgi:hypothetical protein